MITKTTTTVYTYNDEKFTTWEAANKAAAIDILIGEVNKRYIYRSGMEKLLDEFTTNINKREECEEKEGLASR